MSDIVDRLRADARRVENPHLYETQSLELYAADEIERLREQIRGMARIGIDTEAELAALRSRLAEAEALLREARACLYMVQDDQIAADIDAFLAADSSRE